MNDFVLLPSLFASLFWEMSSGGGGGKWVEMEGPHDTESTLEKDLLCPSCPGATFICSCDSANVMCVFFLRRGVFTARSSVLNDPQID